MKFSISNVSSKSSFIEKVLKTLSCENKKATINI